MKLFGLRDLRIVVAVLFFAFFDQNQMLSAEGPQIIGTVIDPAAEKKQVKGIKVSVYSAAEELVGEFQSTGDSGIFTVQCEATTNQVEVHFIDRDSTDRGFGYAPVEFQSLSGLEDMILNPTLQRTKTQTAPEARKTMQGIERLIPRLGNEDRQFIGCYVADAVRGVRENPELAFGEELQSVVKLLQVQESHSKVAVSDDRVLEFNIESQALTKWTIPFELKEPVELQSKYIDVPANIVKLLVSKYSEIGITPSGTRIWDNELIKGRPHSVYARTSGHDDYQKWVTTYESRPFTTGATSTTQALEVIGTPDGKVQVRGVAQESEATLFDVGPTPVAATTVSRDGRMFAAVTIDGTFRVWRLDDGAPVGKAVPIAEGLSPKLFPTSIAIAPDGQSLVMGTGLEAAGKENGVIAVDLRPEGKLQSFVFDVDAPIRKVDFGLDSNSILAVAEDGSMSSMLLSRSATAFQLEERFRFKGIKNFGVTPSGDSAVIWAMNQGEPIGVPVSDLFRTDVFREPKFGIEVMRE